MEVRSDWSWRWPSRRRPLPQLQQLTATTGTLTVMMTGTKPYALQDCFEACAAAAPAAQQQAQLHPGGLHPAVAAAAAPAAQQQVQLHPTLPIP